MFVTDNFGLRTEIAAYKFLHGLAVVWPETFLGCLLYTRVYTFFFLFVLCLRLARDHAP